MAQISSSRWANVNLDRQTEHEAAIATVKFLEKVRDTLSEGDFSTNKTLLTIPFREFDPKHLDFVLATVGSGEVRATIGQSIRLEETAIEGLWRVQENGVDRFEVVTVPSDLLRNLSTTPLEPQLTEIPQGVFAASAILQELSQAQRTENLEKLSVEPPYTVEISRQPLSPEDGSFLEAALGKGVIDISISGFASAHIQSTAMKGIWRNRIFNNAGKALFDAYVVTMLPPEVGESAEEMKLGAQHCEEILQWLKEDIQSGSL